MSVPLLDVGAQNLPLEAELKEVFARVLRSSRFILGEEVEAFERECAEYLGVKHALSISSGTDALLIALMALGIGPGDEVLCPSFTFFATAGSIARTGAIPVFCDVCPVTFNLDLASARRKVSGRTKAVMPVHLFGQAVEMEGLLAFAREYGLAVIEDAAQSIGATYRGERCGSMGDFGSFSFFPSKNLGGFGDGGLVTTMDDEKAERLVRLRNHGMHPRYHHSLVGGNFRMDALQCALLRVKLRCLDGYAEGRRKNAEGYTLALGALPGVAVAKEEEVGPMAEQEARWDREGVVLVLPVACESRGHVWNQYTLRVRGGRRDALKEHLAARGVASEIYYPIPLHRQECFGDLAEEARCGCEVSEVLAAEVLSIPVYPELSEAQKAEVVEAVASFLS